MPRGSSACNTLGRRARSGCPEPLWRAIGQVTRPYQTERAIEELCPFYASLRPQVPGLKRIIRTEFRLISRIAGLLAHYPMHEVADLRAAKALELRL